MNSNIATRRVNRTARPATLKDTENANARPTRPVRAKPLSSHTSTTNATTSLSNRLTATTAASRAKAANVTTALQDHSSKLDNVAGKRKREALGEIPTAGGNKQKVIGFKGKEKESSTIASKGVKTTAAGIRAPLRATADTKVASNVVSITEVREEVVAIKSDHGMQIDAASVATVPIPSLAPRLSARKPLAPRATGGNGSRRILSSRSHAIVPQQHVVDDEAESDRVYKKRRTSSDAPIDAMAEEEQQTIDAEARIAEELSAYADAEPEADPEGDQWDDLDAEDADDPVMVSEYVIDIFNYLKHIELATMPNPNYMDSQKELAWKMRGILTDWLIQVHVRFRLLPETLFLAINIIDRFLSLRVVSLAKLQLVGVTCMFIAAKFEEVIAPSVTHFLLCADSSYSEDEILKAERYVLKTLEWDLSYPNPVHYLRRISKADEYDVKVRTLGKYLLEIGCLEWRLIATPPSLMAAAAIWLARLALGRGDWTPNLAHYSSYSESRIIPTANLMLNFILKPVRHESFHRKYAGKRYYKSSLYMREWALDRWVEGTALNLSKELPALKHAIREEQLLTKARLEQEEVEGALEEEADA